MHELDISHNTITASILPNPAGPFAQPEAVDENGVPSLEDLDVADSGVCDVRVHTGCTVPAWSGT